MYAWCGWNIFLLDCFISVKNSKHFINQVIAQGVYDTSESFTITVGQFVVPYRYAVHLYY